MTSSYASACRAPGCLEDSVGTSMLHEHLLWAVTHLGAAQYIPPTRTKGFCHPTHCAALQGFAQGCWWLLWTAFLGGICPLLMQDTGIWSFNQETNGLYGRPLFHSTCKPDTRNGMQWSFLVLDKQTRISWAFPYKKFFSIPWWLIYVTIHWILLERPVNYRVLIHCTCSRRNCINNNIK